MKQMTRSEWNAMRDDIVNALEDVGKTWGVNFSCGNAKYSDIDFTIQLKGTESDEEKLAVGEKERFNNLSGRYGFDPEDYYKTIDVGGRTYAFSGFNPKARKYTCELTDISNGKKSYTSPSYIRQYI